MKKYLSYLVFGAFVSILVASCGEAKPDLILGKWDLTNNPSSHFQKTLELKENNVFIETWILTPDDESEQYTLEIQGKFSLEETEERGIDNTALCRVYDLKTLCDPHGILEIWEQEDYFAEENKKYYDDKKLNRVYGIQGIRATPTRLYYEADAEKGGIKYEETREALRITDSEGEPNPK